MNRTEAKRFSALYERHQKLLILQGKSPSTVSAYSRAVRRVSGHFDRCPDRLSQEQLEDYFLQLVESHSWSTVKLDRLGLQFFWKHVLKKDWQWLNIVKPPQIKSIPDIVTPEEIEQLLAATRKLCYRVFLLTTYSMGLRLEEALSLQVSDIDSKRMLVHIRRGKGHKDRMIPLPDRTLAALRVYWREHRHPEMLFPNRAGNHATIRRAVTHMDKGGAQSAMKRVVQGCGIKKNFNPFPAAQLRNPPA